MLAFTDEFSWLFEGLSTYTTLHEKGMRLYDLGAFKYAQQFLQLPAAVGDAEAQFALASIIERDPSETLSTLAPLKQALAQAETISLPEDVRATYIQQVGQQISDIENAFKARYLALYQAAAEQGHIDAMLRLGGDEWAEKVRLQLAPGVQSNESEALLNMYALTRELEWLKKASGAGNAVAHYLLALRYNENPELYIPAHINLSLETHIDSVLRSAVIGGYPPAMYWYANRLKLRGNFIFIQHLRIDEAKAGSIDAVARYGLALSGFYSDEQYNDTDSGFDADYVKGYGLLWLVNQVKGRESAPVDVKNILAQLERELTQVQINEGINWARYWREQYPLLSEFRLRACLR